MTYFAGFDVGGTRLKYGLVDADLKRVHQNSRATPDSGRALLNLLRELWSGLIREAPGDIRAAGLGLPGLFSRRERRVLQSPNCPAVENLAIAPELEGFMDVPFHLDNEANFAAYGEYRAGAGRGGGSLVMLTIGTGIGTGIVLDGRIWRGACGYAGELGHAPVNPQGIPCRCGSRGCLETEVSASRIVENYLAGRDEPEPPTAREVHRRAERGDPAAREAFRTAGRFLGLGIATVVNLLNPERIVLGGGVMNAHDLLLPPALEEAALRSYRGAFDGCTIHKAELGNDAGFMGAAAWARDALVRKRAPAAAKGEPE